MESLYNLLDIGSEVDLKDLKDLNVSLIGSESEKKAEKVLPLLPLLQLLKPGDTEANFKGLGVGYGKKSVLDKAMAVLEANDIVLHSKKGFAEKSRNGGIVVIKGAILRRDGFSEYTGELEVNTLNGRIDLVSGNNKYSDKLETKVSSISFSDGGRYVGEVVTDGAFFASKYSHGFGFYYFKNGDVFCGTWKDGKRDGDGVYYCANGDNFHGTWSNGIRVGEGVYNYHRVDCKINKFVGRWDEKWENTEGAYHYRDGGISYGKWTKDTAKGTHYYKSGDRDGDEACFSFGSNNNIVYKFAGTDIGAKIESKGDKQIGIIFDSAFEKEFPGSVICNYGIKDIANVGRIMRDVGRIMGELLATKKNGMTEIIRAHKEKGKQQGKHAQRNAGEIYM